MSGRQYFRLFPFLWRCGASTRRTIKSKDGFSFVWLLLRELWWGKASSITYQTDEDDDDGSSLCWKDGSRDPFKKWKAKTLRKDMWLKLWKRQQEFNVTFCNVRLLCLVFTLSSFFHFGSRSLKITNTLRILNDLQNCGFCTVGWLSLSLLLHGLAPCPWGGQGELVSKNELNIESLTASWEGSSGY